MNNTIIVFGGDGFCGWPTSLALSCAGFKVIIIDNLVRRKIDIELGCQSLTPIQPIEKRLERWENVTNRVIEFESIDVDRHYHRILTLFNRYKPKVVIHFAEQRAAPYSMKSSYHKRYTVNNNINTTNNILCAIVESGLDIHMIHLGTTGVYGYGTPDMPIPEGYLKVKVGNKEMEILYPSHPGSIYHMTKCQDAISFYYYNKNDNVRITDLHQGIVWGTQTDKTSLDKMLINRFDYDGDYGTVLNRFLMQAAIGHPLTVYGSGGQTRAFIHIRDTVKCIQMAVKNPPLKGERVKIFNQTSECLNINDLALKIAKITNAEIRYYKNPRNEDDKNDLMFVNEGFKSLGWKPILLDDALLTEVKNIANKYKYRCDKSKIICTSLWDKNKQVDISGRKI